MLAKLPFEYTSTEKIALHELYSQIDIDLSTYSDDVQRCIYKVFRLRGHSLDNIDLADVDLNALLYMAVVLNV